MKKLALILGVVAVIGFSSCKKEKNCKCITTVGGIQSSEAVITTTESCSSLNTEVTSGGITAVMTCTEE